MLRYITPDEFEAFTWALAAERTGAHIINIMFVPSMACGGNNPDTGWRVFARGSSTTHMKKEMHKRIAEIQKTLIRDPSIREMFDYQGATA